MAITTEEWMKKVKRFSENFESCLETNWTDDTCGWGARLQTILYVEEGLRPFGLLLTGQEGCGRHTAAAHIVRFLWKRDFSSIWLTGYDLLSDGGVSVAQERLDALFDDFQDQEKGLCLVVEQLEGWDGRSELLTYLGRTLWVYWHMQDEYQPLFLILIDSGRSIPSLLRGRLQQCRMTPPNREQRQQFLKNRGSASGLTKYVAADVFADSTEGFSYAQLLDLVGNLCMQVYQTDLGVSAEKLEQMVAEQQGETAEVQSAQRRAALEDALLKLVETLPELLRNVPLPQLAAQPVTQPVLPVIPEPVVEPLPDGTTGPTYKDLERMRVKELTYKLFGKERAERLIQSTRESVVASEEVAQNAEN